jgi:hypothetical protein
MLLLLTACGTPAASVTDRDGSCGDGVSYEYNATTKKLTIKGEGSMKDYASASEVPWHAYRTQIEKIAIDSGVKHIGDYAFYYCTGLKEVGIASTVLDSIGKNAFWMCSLLSEITLPESVAVIGDGAFAYCTQLEMFTVSALSSLGMGAFVGCTHLKSVSIGGTLTEIPPKTFMNCTALTSVVYPETVTADVEALKASDAFTNVPMDKVTFAVVKESASLTVEYVTKDGDQETVIDSKVLGTYKKGESVTVEPAVLEGYTLKDGEKTVTVVMPGMDYTVKFFYTKNAAEETTESVETTAPAETGSNSGTNTKPEEKTPVIFLVVLVVLLAAIAVGAVLLVRSNNSITKDSQTVRKNGDDKKGKNRKK